MDWEFGGSKGETGIRKNENMLNVGFSLKVIVAGYPGAVSERNKLYRQAGTVNFMDAESFYVKEGFVEQYIGYSCSE